MKPIEQEIRCGNCVYFESHNRNWGNYGICYKTNNGVFFTTLHKNPIDALNEAGEIDRLAKIATGEESICFKLLQPTE